MNDMSLDLSRSISQEEEPPPLLDTAEGDEPADAIKNKIAVKKQVLDDLPVARSKNSAPAGYLKSKDASSILAVVLIGVAAAFCATFVTKPCVASKLAELNNPVACPPQWLPVLVASNSHETSAVWRVMLLLCS